MNTEFDYSLNDSNSCIVEFADKDESILIYKEKMGYPESDLGIVKRLFKYCSGGEDILTDIGEAATFFYDQERNDRNLVYILSKKTIDEAKVDYYYKFTIYDYSLEIFLVLGGDKIVLDKGVLDKNLMNKWASFEKIDETLYLAMIVTHRNKINRVTQRQEDTARNIDL